MHTSRHGGDRAGSYDLIPQPHTVSRENKMEVIPVYKYPKPNFNYLLPPARLHVFKVSQSHSIHPTDISAPTNPTLDSELMS